MMMMLELPNHTRRVRAPRPASPRPDDFTRSDYAIDRTFHLNYLLSGDSEGLVCSSQAPPRVAESKALPGYSLPKPKLL